MRSIVFLLFALALAGCLDGPEKDDPFLRACTVDSECPGGWTCPDPADDRNGLVIDVCTPSCHTDDLCQEILERHDVFCYVAGFCAISCRGHEDCPEELPYCRGSHPDCPSDIDPWCSTQDYDCSEADW